jgi:flagellar basal-body rod protein FlgF
LGFSHNIYMIRGANISADGMENQKQMQEILADNLANTSTTGYKSYNIIHKLKALENSEDLTSSEAYGTSFDFSQGALRQTENPLDLAINGKGFFAVIDAQGEIAYTRNGHFNIDNKGFLVTQHGDQVLDGSYAPIFIGIDNVRTIDFLRNGNLIVNGDYTTTLKAYVFEKDQGILKLAQGKYKPSNAGEILNSDIDSTIMQGFLEQSNVNSIEASTDMIQIQRDYEANQKALKVQMDSIEMLFRISDLQ